MTKGIVHQAERLLAKEGLLDHHSRIIQKLVNEIHEQEELIGELQDMCPPT